MFNNKSKIGEIKKRIIIISQRISIYSLLFFIASISIVALAPIFISVNITSPPSQFNKGDIYQQSLVAGRGQTIIIHAKAVHEFRITIVHEDKYTSYIENYSSQFTLFDQEVRIVNYQLTLHKYTRIFIYWNNSVNNNNTVDNNYISHTQSITGIDIDLLLVSGFFALSGLFIELGNHFFEIKHERQLFKIKKLLSPANKSKYEVKLKELSLIINQDGMKNSRGYPIILILLLWFVITPSKQFTLESHSGFNLMLNLLTGWFSNMNQVITAWTTILGLLGFQLWKMKIETNELRNLFVLPIRRSFFGIAMLINLIPSCGLAITLPIVASIILNMLRFELIPEITTLILVFFFMLFSSITLIFLGVVAGLIRPSYTLYQGILLYYLLLGLLYLPLLALFPNILTPLPNGLELIYLNFQSQSLNLFKWIEFLIISIIVISGLFYIYIRSIKRLEVN